MLVVLSTEHWIWTSQTGGQNKDVDNWIGNHRRVTGMENRIMVVLRLRTFLSTEHLFKGHVLPP